MIFADLRLAQRLERAEGHACAQFATARRRRFPQSGAEWIQCGGAYAVFDGILSPVTQSFGLGLFEEVTAEILESIERFFMTRGAPANHEVCPHVGAAALRMLCARGYQPVEISNVLFQRLEERSCGGPDGIRVRTIAPGETGLWTRVNDRGWAKEHAELTDFLSEVGVISASREGTVCFLAELDGHPGAAGALCVYGGVALLAGASTVPEMRRKGLQSALLRERLQYALEHGCDLAMMAAEPGSASQRNAERNGFRIAYTRTKWALTPVKQA